MTEKSSRRWFGLVFISLGVALIIVDSTIVNVAVPSIVEDLGISSTQVQWVQEAYTLVFASLLLLFGSLADKFGRRRMMLIVLPRAADDYCGLPASTLAGPTRAPAAGAKATASAAAVPA